MFDLLLYLTIVAMICIGEVDWLRVSSLLTSRYVAVYWWGGRVYELPWIAPAWWRSPRQPINHQSLSRFKGARGPFWHTHCQILINQLPIHE